MAIALYPGGFKPPHKGHFAVVDRLLSGTAKGLPYTQQNYKTVGAEILSTKGNEIDNIDKVVVFIGPVTRNGIDQQLSEYIWNIYKQYIPYDLEIIASPKAPPMAAKDYVKSNPDEQYYIITGVRNRDSVKDDMGKLNPYKNYDNVKGLGVSPGNDTAEVSGTKLRKAALEGDVKIVKNNLPSDISDEELEDIIERIKTSVLSEQMAKQIDDVFEGWFGKEPVVVEEVTENSSGTPIAPRSAIRSADRHKLVVLYNRLRNMIGDSNYKIIYNHDHIRIQLPGGLNENLNSATFDFTPYIASIIEYMIDKGMTVTPIPGVRVVRDIEQASNVFGRTAYYNPVDKEITLYTEGRHPKDILRSFAHEMIHHIQNLEGRLHGISTTNTNEDDRLLELEKEAYLEGNITFRNWEDGIKNSNPYINESESSYDIIEWLADELAEKYVTEFRENFEDFGNTKYHIEEFISKSGLSFELDVTLMFSDKVKDIDGQAYAVTDFEEEDDDYKEDDRVEVEIHVNPKMEKAYSVMQETLLQFLVHEFEHLRHGDGVNRVEDERIPEVNKIRSLINMGAIPAYTYRLLPREVAAAVREFMAKAKSSGREFADIVADELEKEGYNQEEKEAILKAYRNRIKEKGLKVLLEEAEEEKVTFYLDMDGVLADFEKRFKDITGMLPPDYEKKHGKEAFWKLIDVDHKIKFWTGIPVLDGAKILVDKVREYGYEILTAPSKNAESRIGKSLWLKNHRQDLFGGDKPKVNFKYSGFKQDVKKNLTKNDILIDDRAKNIDPWIAAGGTGILYQNINQVITDIDKLGL